MKRRKTSSVRQRYSGQTFAQAAAQISKKYEDRDTNPLAKRSFMAEMEELVKLQESMRVKDAAINTIQEYRAPKMQWGGMLGTSVIPGLTSVLKKNDPLTTPPLEPLPTLVDMWPKTRPLTFLEKISSSPDFSKKPDISSIAKTVGTTAKLNPVTFSEKPMATVAQGVRARAANPGPILATSRKEDTPTSIFTPMILSKTAELLGKGFMVLGGYDKVSPELNPFESEIRDNLRKMRFDNTAITQRIQGEMERARGLAKGIRSEAVRQALYQNAQNQANQALSEVDVQGQVTDNQYRQARASALNTLGQQSVQARQYAEQLNNQSKIGYQMGLQTILESVGNIGQQVTNYKANIAQQRLLASALQTANFKFGDVGQIIAKAVNEGKLTLDDFFEINNTATNAEEALTLAKKKMDKKLKDANN